MSQPFRLTVKDMGEASGHRVLRRSKIQILRRQWMRQMLQAISSFLLPEPLSIGLQAESLNPCCTHPKSPPAVPNPGAALSGTSRKTGAILACRGHQGPARHRARRRSKNSTKTKVEVLCVLGPQGQGGNEHVGIQK